MDQVELLKMYAVRLAQRLGDNQKCLEFTASRDTGHGIEIRPNEHNHKGQMAHIHIYIHGEEVGSMFLNGELRDGKLKSKDMKIVRQYVLENADELQALWNEYQNSAY